MDKKERRRLFLNTASLGGLLIGIGIFILLLLLSSLVNPYNGLILGVIINVITWGYILGKRFKQRLGDEVLTYGRALALLVLMLVLGGVVMGTVIYLICNILAPEMFRDMFETFKSTIASTPNITQLEMDQINQLYLNLQNPIMVILSSTFSILFFGAFPSLFIATFIRTKINKTF